MPGIAILEALSALGHVPEHRGVEKAPARLLEEGIAEGLGAVAAGRVEAPGDSAARDPQTQVIDVEPLVEYSSRLADAVGEIVDAGRFALVLGGDCSILLGAMLGLRRRGRFGLLYIDGHADYWQPERNTIDGAPPRRRTLPSPPAAAQRRGDEELDGLWIHVDADVLDGAIMSAVDDPSPDGFIWGEPAAALGMAIGSGLAVGLQVTIYNPDFDETGANGRGLATTVNTVLSEFT